MIYKEHTHCRVCGSNQLTPYLDLGYLPLSNNLAENATDTIHDRKYPLKVCLCNNCNLSQLSVVVDPNELFSNYTYRSGISQGYINHCKQMAISLKEKYNLNENSFHIDIAGNDCTLLEQFREVVGGIMLNIDPAANLVNICETKDIRTFKTFWGVKAAQHLVNTRWPKADLITATNVFAHVDSVREFMAAVKMVLSPTGVLVLEFPYLIDFIENKEFDTIYFEHLSYFSILPLALLCQYSNMKILNVEKQTIHGGSVRVTIGSVQMQGDNTVVDFITQEQDNYRNIKRYSKFAEDVKHSISSFQEGIKQLTGNISGFAASAKGNTLLNVSGINYSNIKFIVDDTLEKIGKYSPGTRIPIVSYHELQRNPPDYLVILSWNFQEEIISRCRSLGYKGHFIIPIPEFQIVE